MSSEGHVPNHVLDSARNFVENLSAEPESAELRSIMGEIDKFGPDARKFLQFLTNSFLEKDVLERTLQNPDSVEEIRQKFSSYGLSQEQTGLVLDYFSKQASEE